jgi:hypothetical protein
MSATYLDTRCPGKIQEENDDDVRFGGYRFESTGKMYLP